MRQAEAPFQFFTTRHATTTAVSYGLILEAGLTSAPLLILNVPLPSKKEDRLMVVHRALLAALEFRAESKAWIASCGISFPGWPL